MFFNLSGQITFYVLLILNINFLAFACIIFFKKSGNLKANRIISAGMVNVVIFNIFLLLCGTNLYNRLPHLLRLQTPLLYTLILPLYFYFIAVLQPNFHFRIKHLFHLVLPAMAIALEFPFYILSAEEKIQWHASGEEVQNWRFMIMAVMYIQVIIYIVIMYMKYHSVKNNLEAKLMSRSEVLKWLREYLWVVLIVFLAAVIPVIAIPFHPVHLIPGINSVFFYLLLFKVILKPDIFSKLEQVKDMVDQTRNKSYFALKEKDIGQMKQKLERVITEKELFFSPDISLSMLSASLGIPVHHLTYLLNKSYRLSYTDLVNSIRIDEAKRRLIDEKYSLYSVEGIGISVGFNSRITFHNVFKKLTRLTPVEYKKKFIS